MKLRTYHILVALADQDRHGQAIAREVARLSEGELHLWPAVLYGALDELVECGWIAETEQPSPDESERKRFYRLTKAGSRALSVETDRLAGLVKVARARVRRAGETS